MLFKAVADLTGKVNLVDIGFIHICDFRHTRLYENDCFILRGCSCEFYGKVVFEMGLEDIKESSLK